MKSHEKEPDDTVKEKLETAGEAADHGQTIAGIGDVLEDLTPPDVTPVVKIVGDSLLAIGYILSALRAMYDLGVTAVKWMKHKKAEQDAIEEEISQNEQFAAVPKKIRLVGRGFANLTIIGLSVVAVVAIVGPISVVAGIFTGVAASLVGWVKDAVVPWWRAHREISHAENELYKEREKLMFTKKWINSYGEGIVPQVLYDGLHAQSEKVRAMQNHCESVRNKYNEKRNDMIVGFLSVLGFALLLSGPFGWAAGAVIGGSIFVGAGLIALGRKAHSWYTNKQTESAAMQPKTDAAPAPDSSNDVTSTNSKKLSLNTGSTVVIASGLHLTTPTLASSTTDLNKVIVPSAVTDTRHEVVEQVHVPSNPSFKRNSMSH